MLEKEQGGNTQQAPPQIRPGFRTCALWGANGLPTAPRFAESRCHTWGDVGEPLWVLALRIPLAPCGSSSAAACGTGTLDVFFLLAFFI